MASYTALYRKFRPVDFSQVRGQDAIVTTLRNQILSNRIGHAYLFTGTRGTGKTSVAKILARAVNCEHPVDGSPCNECASCRAILAGTSMNVIEIDAASNNGVDNIRQIIDEVQYSPTEGRYKVYIIDEVHMLSTGAFNALLKTLEEPPAYVIFILATTEPHKIPITILSRCQRYDFRRMSIDTVAAHLENLLSQEGVEYEEKAVRYIAKMADGSMRDGLSILDQCISFYFNQKLTYEKVLAQLGTVDAVTFSQMLRAVMQEDVVRVLELLDAQVTAGADLDRLIQDFAWYLRNVLLLQASEQAADLVDVPADQITEMVGLGQELDADQLMRYIRVLSEAAQELRYSGQKRVTAEMAFVKLCRPQMEQNLDAITDRVRQLETKVKEGVPVRQMAAQGKASETPKPQKQIRPEAVSEDLREVAANWQSILQSADHALKAVLSDATPSTGDGNTLELVFTDPTCCEFASREENKARIARVIEERIDKSVRIQTRLLAQGQSKAKVFDLSKLTEVFAGTGIEIEME